MRVWVHGCRKREEEGEKKKKKRRSFIFKFLEGSCILVNWVLDGRSKWCLKQFMAFDWFCNFTQLL